MFALTFPSFKFPWVWYLLVTIFSEQIAYFRHPPACVSSDLRWWQTNILTEIFNTVFPSFVPPPSARLRTRYIKLFRLYSPLNISCLGSTSGLTSVRPRELLNINLVQTLHAVCFTSVYFYVETSICNVYNVVNVQDSLKPRVGCVISCYKLLDPNWITENTVFKTQDFSNI